MKLLWAASELLLIVLAGFVYLASIAVASSVGFVAMVATTLLPGISQAYWIWSISAATGTLPQPLTLLCQVWLVLLVIWVYARDITLRRAAQ
jgi:hypothetical protein